jgi:hypothetical protein
MSARVPAVACIGVIGKLVCSELPIHIDMSLVIEDCRH